MQIKGNLQSVTMDIVSGKYLYTFASRDRPSDDLRSDTDLLITAEVHREKRSRNANAYLWVLLQQIAEKVDSDRWSVYLKMLKRYSRKFDFYICKEQAVERFKQCWREVIDLGEIEVNGQKGHQLQVFYGSSTFNSKEMSVLLNGVVSECKELGIPTLDELEIARLCEKWQSR